MKNLTPDCWIGADITREYWQSTILSQALFDGDIVTCYEWCLSSAQNEVKIVVMPLSRVNVDYTIVYPSGVIVFPPGIAQLEMLNPIEYSENSFSLAELTSAFAGVTVKTLNNHSLIAFPCEFDWRLVEQGSHNDHLDLIRSLSEQIDRRCMNLLRYELCGINLIDTLPAKVGQLSNNMMMSGALIYNPSLHQGRLIGGAAFTHYITRGLGLDLQEIDWTRFPAHGETGRIINHALSLYSAMLAAESQTVQFMQAITLLEFLAYPNDYKGMKDVKKVIARYAAKNASQYEYILNRFFELTGKRDPLTNEIVGFRTRIVHMGEPIESMVHSLEERRKLFKELDSYIHSAMDHMIEHSDLSFESYLLLRADLQPYRIENKMGSYREQ